MTIIAFALALALWLVGSGSASRAAEYDVAAPAIYYLKDEEKRILSDLKLTRRDLDSAKTRLNTLTTHPVKGAAGRPTQEELAELHRAEVSLAEVKIKELQSKLAETRIAISENLESDRPNRLNRPGK